MVILGLILICIIIIARTDEDWLATLSIVIGVVSIGLLFIPTEGWQEKQCVSEQCLVEIKLDEQNETDQVYYLKEVEYGMICAVDASTNYELTGIAYDEKKISEPLVGSLEVYESKDCTIPILKKYKTRPNRGTFTFAPFSTKTDYIFYVPEGTVLHRASKENSRESSSSSQE